jgi:hypothetical protein
MAVSADVGCFPTQKSSPFRRRKRRWRGSCSSPRDFGRRDGVIGGSRAPLLKVSTKLKDGVVRLAFEQIRA